MSRLRVMFLNSFILSQEVATSHELMSYRRHRDQLCDVLDLVI